MISRAPPPPPSGSLSAVAASRDSKRLPEVTLRRAEPRQSGARRSRASALFAAAARPMRSTSERRPADGRGFIAALFTISRAAESRRSPHGPRARSRSQGRAGSRRDSTMQSARPAAGRDDLHRAVETDDLGLDPPCRRRISAWSPRTWSPPSDAGAQASHRRPPREHEPAAGDAQIERLVESGAAVLQQDVLSRDAEVRRPVLDEGRNVLRAQHEDADVFEARSRMQSRRLPVGSSSSTMPPRASNGVRLVADPPFRQRDRQHGKPHPGAGVRARVTPEPSGMRAPSFARLLFNALVTAIDVW